MTPEQMEDKNNIDAMLLLEGKLNERVEELIDGVVTRTVINIIGKQVYEAFEREKADLFLMVEKLVERELNKRK